MSILNYSTRIDPIKSAGEIQGLLARKGAGTVSLQYASGEPVAVFFSIDFNGSPINFRLPSNWEGVHAVIMGDPKIPSKFKSKDQSKRVAWRIVKDWVEAQLAIIESGQAEMAEVFLPYAITQGGSTLFERLGTNSQLLLS